MRRTIPDESCQVSADDPAPDKGWQVSAGDPLALTKMLGLGEFSVSKVEYDDELACLVFSCGIARDTAVCPDCNEQSSHIHQQTLRVVRDLPVWGKACSLEFALRRFDCEKCKQPFTESLESVAPYARCTRRYERYLFKQCQGTSIRKIAQQEVLGYKSVEGIYYRLAEQQTATGSGVLLSRLGIDEISLKKGHCNFVLVITDLERHQVIKVLPDRTKEVLEEYLGTWSQEEREAVQEVATDLWQPYSAAVEAKLPNARITADRFHVMKNLNDGVTSARREIQRSASKEEKQQLKGSRWSLVKNEKNLKEEEAAKLAEAFEISPVLKELHGVKEDFRMIFETAETAEEAARRLEEWIKRVEDLGLEQLDSFIKTLCSWWEKILNYFHLHITSGIVEGINNKIKLIKRIGFGYRNFRHFSLRVLVECGGSP